MKKDDLENLFDDIKERLDFEEPREGHQKRFLDKLNKQQNIADPKKPLVISLPKTRLEWYKISSIAAAVVLLIALSITFTNKPSIEEQLVEIAPEVSKTEFYFANLIQEQVELLEKEKSPETKKLINDTLKKLDELDSDYQSLENELVNGGNSKIILNAMIINFQTRIDLLKEVLTQVENIKNIKTYNDENFTL